MKLTMPIVLLACALALGSCHSNKKTVATTGPAAERPVWRPKEAPVTGSSQDSNDAALVARLIDGAYQWIGTPYLYGGTGRKGVDCSGFVQKMLARDLVFFNGSRIGSGIGHVGLYVGEDHIIHASSSRGVTVSAITDKYYTDRYCGSGRVEGITYRARGTRPGSERELPVIVVQTQISALVDSAFARCDSLPEAE